MRVYTKYQLVPQRGRKPRRKRTMALAAALVLLAGVAWIALEKGWIETGRDRAAPIARPAMVDGPTSSTVANPTNFIAQKRESASNDFKIRSVAPPMEMAAVLAAQIALDSHGISPGSIDGVLGSQTRAAVRAFQSREGLSPTGELDAGTRATLALATSPLTRYRIETNDLERLRPLAGTWYGKSKQERLEYETFLEYIAERSHSHPNLIRRLNSAVAWTSIQPGSEIIVPVVERRLPSSRAAWLQIRLSERTLRAFDSTNRLLAHFPCSIAQRVEKRPAGELRVTVVVPNPDYMFNPEIFPESDEAREWAGRKLRINPGPNNPVGTAWIGLNLSGYGIHGTPKPEDVGRTESHGCFRLANWNADYLLQLVAVGTPVRIEP